MWLIIKVKMQAEQLIWSAGFNAEERRFNARENQIKTLVNQAEICADSCLNLNATE